MKINIFEKIKKYIKSMKPKKMVDTLFASYMVLIIVPILLLGSAFMMISAHQQLEQTQDIRLSVLESATDMLREKVDAIYNASYDVMCNSDIVGLGEYTDFTLDRSLELVSVKNFLQRTVVQTDIISEIYLYYKNSDITVCPRGEKREIYSMFNMQKDEFHTYLENNNGKIVSAVANVDFDEDENCVMYIKSVDRKMKTGNVFVLCILDSRLLTKIIETVNLDGAGSSILLDQEYNCMLSIGDEQLDYSSVAGEEFFSKISGQQYETVILDGEKVDLLLKEVPLTNLKILSSVKKSYYLIKFQYVWFLILIICAFIIAVGVWVARTYSKRIYQPITNIVNLFKSGAPDELEKSELLFIESKFVEMNEMNSELAEYKDTYSSYLKEQFVYNFIKGYISDYSDFRDRLNEFNARLATEYYTVLLIKIDRLNEVLKNIQLYHFQSYVKESFASAFEKYFVGKYDCLHEFYDGEYIGIIICHDSHIELESGIEKVQGYISKELDITISVCVGETMVSWEELPATYEKLYLYMMQNRLCGAQFLQFVQEAPVQNEYINFSKYDEKICVCITKCDYESLDALIEEMFKKDKLFYNEIVQLFNSFIITLMGIINGSGYSANDILMNIKPYTDIEKFTTVDELCNYLKKVCRLIGDSIADSARDKNVMLGKIYEYFRQNYMNQITLEIIAKDFGFSAGYFSRYFKEVTGKKYVEMLNNYRIEKAKEIIRSDKTAKLFEVSEKVGFVRYRTFSDAFKKYTGQSPENFKRSL